MNFREKLKNRELVTGTWFTIPSVTLADVICSSGIDYLIIDREHGTFSFESVLSNAIAAKSNDVASVVRCTAVDPAEILRCLDVGVDGIQVPNVNCTSEVEELLQHALYYPEGNRGYSVFTRNGRYGAIPAEEMSQLRNDQTAIIINIESIESAENIHEFLEIERVDAFFIGLFDLSKSLGRPGDFTTSEFKDAVEHVTKACKNSGRSVGTICKDVEIAKNYIALGMNYIVYSVDNNIIRSCYQDFTLKLKGDR